MQREIKFRAWRADISRMIEKVYHFDPLDNNAEYSVYEDWRDHADGVGISCILMQYTGLKDRNGKEIYEGDILDLSDGPAKVVYADSRVSYEVIFSDEANLGLWEACGYGRDLSHIIGNIYENPELLKP